MRAGFPVDGIFLFTVALIAISWGTVACARDIVEGQQRQECVAAEAIENVLNQHSDELMSLPGVVGTAIGECEGKPCIKVLVVKETPELVNKIPRTLEGYPVVI